LSCIKTPLKTIGYLNTMREIQRVGTTYDTDI
jgi:hypothetical protein